MEKIASLSTVKFGWTFVIRAFILLIDQYKLHGLLKAQGVYGQPDGQGSLGKDGKFA